MPVRKYRSAEDVPQRQWRAPLDSGNLKLAADLSQLAGRFRPRHFPPGLHKHRSIYAACRVREVWERE